VPWAADVTRGSGVPSALYWIQPAAVFAVYHHYFHGYTGAVAEHYRHGDPSFVGSSRAWRLWRSGTC